MQNTLGYDSGQPFCSYYIAFFQLPYLPERIWSVYDWAAYKFLLHVVGTPVNELETTLDGFGARENPDTIHYAINWYRGNFSRIANGILEEEAKMIPHDTLMLWGNKDKAWTSKPILYRLFIYTKNAS